MKKWGVNFLAMKTWTGRKISLISRVDTRQTRIWFSLIRTTLLYHSWIYDIITYTNWKKCVYCMWSTRQTKSICQLDKEDRWYEIKNNQTNARERLKRISFFFCLLAFIRRSTKNDHQLYDYAHHLSIESSQC